MSNENGLSREIIGAAIEAHRGLGGPGLLESVYEEALEWELRARGLAVERRVAVPIRYKGHTLGTPLRLDLRIERKVIVECKAVVTFHPMYLSQALTYLRQLDLRLPLVINFGERYVRDGIHRVVNNLPELPFFAPFRLCALAFMFAFRPQITIIRPVLPP